MSTVPSVRNVPRFACVALALATFGAHADQQPEPSDAAALLHRVHTEVLQTSRQKRDPNMISDLLPALADAWADLGNQPGARMAIGECIQQVLSLKDGLERASALLRIAKAQLRMDDNSGAESTLRQAEAAARAAPVEGDFVAHFKQEILNQTPQRDSQANLLAKIDGVRLAIRNPNSSSQNSPPVKESVLAPGGSVFQSALALLRTAPKAAKYGEIAVAQWKLGDSRAAREALDSARAEIRTTTDVMQKLEQFAALAEICDRTGNRPMAASLVEEEGGTLEAAPSGLASQYRLSGLAFLAEMQAHAGDSNVAAETFRKAIQASQTEPDWVRCWVAQTVAESEVRAGTPQEAARTAIIVAGIKSGPLGVGAYFPNSFEKAYGCADVILDKIVAVELERGAPKDALATLASSTKPVGQVTWLCEIAVEFAEQGDPPAAARVLQQAVSGANGIENRAARENLYEKIAVAQAKTGSPPDGWALARRIGDKLQQRDAVRQVAGTWARTAGQQPSAVAFADREPDPTLRLYGLVGIVAYS